MRVRHKRIRGRVVTCSLGKVAFDGDGVSEEISAEVAGLLLSIPDYTIHEGAGKGAVNLKDEAVEEAEITEETEEVSEEAPEGSPASTVDESGPEEDEEKPSSRKRSTRRKRE